MTSISLSWTIITTQPILILTTIGYGQPLHFTQKLVLHSKNIKKNRPLLWHIYCNVISFVYLCKNNMTMGQTATTIRIDADLKAEFDKLCEDFGMSANTAFNIYVKTVVRQRRIPFTIEADPIDEVMERGRRAFYEMRKIAAENGTAGMSLDEINEEIRLARRGE